MKKLSFDNYDLYIINELNEFNLDNKIKELCHAKQIMVITDTNVDPLYSEQLISSLPSFKIIKYVINAGDQNKNIATYTSVTKDLLTNFFSREDLIISLGGGMVSDVAGFVAATFKRGLKLIHIPTTIIGQIDAAIGGKVAINFNDYKNQIGTFYDPILVVNNLAFLKTLPVDEFKSGLGEIIKTGLIGDEKLFTYFEKEKIELNSEILLRALSVKKTYIEKDYYDLKERAVLNLGHSFAHALESKTYFKTPHGIAVLAGIFKALEFGEYLKITNPQIKERLFNIINKLEIPLPALNFKDCLTYLQNDKKASQISINLITLEEICQPVIINARWEDFDALND